MPMKSTAVLICIALQIVVLVIGARLISQDGLPKESSFALVLVFAVVFLMTTLFVLAAGFAQLRLTDKSQALGLPSGSVRAMIALILILVFIMFGVYLYLNESIYVDMTGSIEMSQDAWASSTNVYSAELIKDTNPPRYKVVLFKPQNEKASDLAQQLLTTVGTLVVAVAGFYFGSASTASGNGEGGSSDPEEEDEADPATGEKEDGDSSQGSASGGSDTEVADDQDDEDSKTT